MFFLYLVIKVKSKFFIIKISYGNLKFKYNDYNGFFKECLCDLYLFVICDL